MTDQRSSLHDHGLDRQARILAPSGLTGGTCSIVELLVTPGSELQAHVHEREDQALVVLEGSADVIIGDHRSRVEAGELAFCPRGVVHQLTVTSGVARLLAVQVPGGLEEFLAVRASTVLDPELLLALAADHGVRIVLPPLNTEARSAPLPTERRTNQPEGVQP